MPSPLSGERTLDKTLRYCSDHGIYSDKNRIIRIGKFKFLVGPHDTGCDVQGWVVDGDDKYEIITTTYWYSSSYTFNKSKWETGAWDEVLAQTIDKLEHAVAEHKLQVAIRYEIENDEREAKKRERKSKFEALFAD